MVKCPCCGFGGEFKLLKMWRYRWWNVYLYERPRCKARHTSCADPEGEREGFVIPFKPRLGYVQCSNSL